MKIAISSDDGRLEGTICPRFGRAPWFLVVEADGPDDDLQIEAVSNSQNVEAAQGAGIQSAQHVVESGAEAVLTGHCGPKAFRTLNAAGVAVYVGVEGDVTDAVKKLLAGELKPTGQADVQGHW